MDTLRDECYVLIKDTLARSDGEETLRSAISQISDYITGISVQSVKIKLVESETKERKGLLRCKQKVFDVNTEADYNVIFISRKSVADF